MFIENVNLYPRKRISTPLQPTTFENIVAKGESVHIEFHVRNLQCFQLNATYILLSFIDILHISRCFQLRVLYIGYKYECTKNVTYFSLIYQTTRPNFLFLLTLN